MAKQKDFTIKSSLRKANEIYTGPKLAISKDFAQKASKLIKDSKQFRQPEMLIDKTEEDHIS